MEPKKNYALQVKKAPKGFFGAPRDLTTHSQFGKRDEIALRSHRRWFMAVLIFVRTRFRAIGF